MSAEVAAALGEGAAEAAAEGAAGAVDVAAGRVRGEAAAAYGAAEAEASPTAVVVVVEHGDEDEAAVTVGALLRLVGLAGAELVGYDAVVLVDAALHLGLAAAGG